MAKHKVSFKDKSKTYIFKVVIEPDEDRWFAYCPLLKGCATWGYTKEEALKNIQEVVDLWVKDMMETGEDIPVEEIETEKEKQRLVFPTPMVAVTV